MKFQFSIQIIVYLYIDKYLYNVIILIVTCTRVLVGKVYMSDIMIILWYNMLYALEIIILPNVYVYT